MSDTAASGKGKAAESDAILVDEELRGTIIGLLANTRQQLCREANSQASVSDVHWHASIDTWAQLKLEGVSSAEVITAAERAMLEAKLAAKRANEWSEIVHSEMDNYLGYLDSLPDEQIASLQANFVAQGNPTCDHYRDFCLGTMSAKQQSEAICMGPMTDLLAC